MLLHNYAIIFAISLVLLEGAMRDVKRIKNINDSGEIEKTSIGVGDEG